MIFNTLRKLKFRTIFSIVEIIFSCFYRLIFSFISKRIRKRLKPKKYYFSVCAIFKNEGTILKEWVTYYKILGCDHLYMYNNNSTDNYNEILYPYIEEGFVTLIDWPQQAAQLKAYEDCYNKYKHETSWLAFFDLDEFIVPMQETTIPEFLKRYEGYPGLIIYWKMFGTNGQLTPQGDKLICEQYTCSWPCLYGTGKVIISTCDCYVPYKIYHHYMYFRYRLLGMINIIVPVVTEHKYFICFPELFCAPTRKNTVQINHYFSKSWSDYREKIAKGDVFCKDYEEARREMDFFYRHEMGNTSVDMSIYRFMIKLKLEYYDEAKNSVLS